MATRYAGFSVSDTNPPTQLNDSVYPYLAIIATGTTSAAAVGALTGATSATTLIYKVISAETTVAITSTASSFYAYACVVRPGRTKVYPNQSTPLGVHLTSVNTSSNPELFPTFFLEEPSANTDDQYVSVGSLNYFRNNLTPQSISGTSTTPTILNMFISPSARKTMGLDSRLFGENTYLSVTGFTSPISTLSSTRVIPLNKIGFTTVWDCSSYGGSSCTEAVPCGADACLVDGCVKDIPCFDSVPCQDVCQDSTLNTFTVDWSIVHNYGPQAMDYKIDFINVAMTSGLTSLSNHTIVNSGTTLAQSTATYGLMSFGDTLSGSLTYSTTASSIVIAMVFRFNGEYAIPTEPPTNPTIKISGKNYTGSCPTSGDGTAAFVFAIPSRTLTAGSVANTQYVVTFNTAA